MYIIWKNKNDNVTIEAQQKKIIQRSDILSLKNLSNLKN